MKTFNRTDTINTVIVLLAAAVLWYAVTHQEQIMQWLGGAR
jgi:hypothetical protein